MKGLVNARKEQLEIEPITVERVRGIISPLEIRAKVLDSLGDGWHVSPLHQSRTSFNVGHRLIILPALGRFIQLGVPQGHTDRAMTHEFFHHLQGRARIQEVGGKRMALMPSSALAP